MVLTGFGLAAGRGSRASEGQLYGGTRNGKSGGEDQYGNSDPEPDGWMIGLTAGLVLVSGLQVWVLIRQTDIVNSGLPETRRATELTRQSFILSNRPRLIVRNVEVNHASEMFHPEPTEPVSSSFFIPNTGLSPGRIISVDCGIYPGETLPMIPPFTSDGQNPDRLLLPGKGTGWQFETRLHDADIGSLEGLISQTAILLCYRESRLRGQTQEYEKHRVDDLDYEHEA